MTIQLIHTKLGHYHGIEKEKIEKYGHYKNTFIYDDLQSLF